jgi:hypothetical protein
MPRVVQGKRSSVNEEDKMPWKSSVPPSKQRKKTYATGRYVVADTFYNLAPGTIMERYLAGNLSLHEESMLDSGVSLGGSEIYMERPCALPATDLEKNKEWCRDIYCLGVEKWTTLPQGEEWARGQK